MNLDIPEEQHLSRNLQTMWAKGAAAGASPDDIAKAVLAIVSGNVMELEQRVVALEKQAGVVPPKPDYKIKGPVRLTP